VNFTTPSRDKLPICPTLAFFYAVFGVWGGHTAAPHPKNGYFLNFCDGTHKTLPTNAGPVIVEVVTPEEKPQAQQTFRRTASMVKSSSGGSKPMWVFTAASIVPKSSCAVRVKFA